VNGSTVSVASHLAMIRDQGRGTSNGKQLLSEKEGLQQSTEEFVVPISLQVRYGIVQSDNTNISCLCLCGVVKQITLQW